MKKKLALLMVLAMAASAVPATSFAATDNSVTKRVTSKVDGFTATYNSTTGAYVDSDNAPYLKLENQGESFGGAAGGTEIFSVILENAKWDDVALEELKDTVLGGSNVKMTGYKLLGDKECVFTYTATAAFSGTDKSINDIKVPLVVKFTDNGDATATIDSMNSSITPDGKHTFGIVASGSVKATIDKSTDIDDSDKTNIKPIILSETTVGSLKKDDTIKFKLGGDFKFINPDDIAIETVVGSAVTFTKVGTPSEDEVEFKVSSITPSTTTPYKLMLVDAAGSTKGVIIGGDDAEAGDEAEITVSGNNITKTTLTVGKYVDYGFSWKAEEGDVPVVYSGRTNEDSDADLLKVMFKETVAKSLINNRKVNITLPEGVKFIEKSSKADIDVDKIKGAKDQKVNFTIDSKDASVATLDTITRTPADTGMDKVEFRLDFAVSADADFTGDIVAKISGPGLANEEMEAVIGTVVAPVTVKVEKTPVAIDYRNVEVGNITITEAYPGALEKDRVLTLQAEKMEFESGMEWEVTEGDIKIDEVKKATVDKTSVIQIKIKSASSKTASTIELSNLSVYLDRTLPVGDYALNVIAANDNDKDAWFYNYLSTAKSSTAEKFDTDTVELVKDYITVKTAGRDQDDSTFTTKISVTVGESKLMADGKEIAMDVPAFINADSRVMLPVRAVVEALSGTVAIKWDDATKTAFFSMGSRVFSMTVGSTTMTINGTPVVMTTAPVIVDSRIFIPLRDLGIALGLNDNKITWDDATKTATLN